MNLVFAPVELPDIVSRLGSLVYKILIPDDPTYYLRGLAYGIPQIAEHYYDYLGAYMDRIYTLTVEAIKRDENEIALQAIEFWSTIAEGELALQDVELRRAIPASKT